MPLGAAARYGLLSGDSINANSAVFVSGRAGGAVVAANVRPADSVFTTGSNLTQARAALQAARSYCAGLTGQAISGSLGGQTLSSGVYTINGDAICAGTSTLTLIGDSTSVVVVNVSGNATFYSNCRVTLQGIRPHHVYWNINGNVLFADQADASGLILGGSSIALQGVQYGIRQLLATQQVSLANLNASVGSSTFYAPAVLASAFSQGPCPPRLLPVPACGNLVTNGDFENFPRCPNALGGIKSNVALSDVCDFLSPGLGTPDYYNACAPAPPSSLSVSVPQNFYTGGLPRASHTAGSGYAGTISFPDQGSGRWGGYREFFTQRLSAPLQAGTYYGEFWVSLAGSSDFATRQLGMWFSPGQQGPQGQQPPQLPNVVTGATATSGILPTPQVTGSPSPGFPNYAPTTNWVRIKGVYTTVGGDQYITFGNFLTNFDNTGNTNFCVAFPPTQNVGIPGAAYYFFDDISLYKLPNAGLAQTITCGGAITLGSCPSLPLQPDGPGLPPPVRYQWAPLTGLDSPTAAQTLAHPATTTTYTLTVTVNGVPTTSTTTVTVLPQATLTTQTINCGASATLPTCGNSLPPGAAAYWTSSPVDGSLSIYALNPVVTPTANTAPGPAITYTYTLNVLYNGVNTQSTTTVVVQPCPLPIQCQHPYKQYAGTYHNPSGPDYNIGDPATVTTLTGDTYFDGIYHVLGPIVLQGGAFSISPGTVFYIDGGQGFPNHLLSCHQNELDGYLRILVSKEATLTISGATLTSTCNEMWGGIEVIDNGRLVTERNPLKKRRTYIDHARVAVMAGCDPNNQFGTYYLTGTTFQNDTYGVAVLGNQRNMSPDECQVYNCRFESALADRLTPDRNQYTHVGLEVRGDNHQDIPYQYNRFTSLLVGADVAGNNMVLDFNNFADCFQAGIDVCGPNVNLFIDYLRVSDNTIEVPTNATPGGQVAANAEVKGIELLDFATGGNEVAVLRNKVVTANSGDPAKTKIGLDGYLRFDVTNIAEDNTFDGFDNGVRLFDASGTNQQQIVTNNMLSNDLQGITLTGGRFAPFSPTLSCNDIVDNDYGIYIERRADVGDLGSASETCGNWFYNARRGSVWNDGANPIDYFAQDSPHENVPSVLSGATAGSRQGFTGNTCSDRNASHGLRPSAGSGITAQDVQDWKAQLLQNTLDPKVLRNFEYFLTDYYYGAGLLADLETYLNQLPMQNDAAFERLSIYLMETYRRNGDDTGAQRVRQDLGSKRGTIPDIAHRLVYFDLAIRLRQLGIGTLPSPADSTLLVDLANAGPAYAPVACATLRYYYPQLQCGNTGTSGPPQARPAERGIASDATASKLIIRAYPNPATEVVTIATNGTVPVDATFELVSVTTGRVVSRQAATSVGSEFAVPVTGLAPGVYAGRLLQGAQLLGTCKVVVVR